MYGAVIHGPGDVRYERRPDPEILEPTDAIVRTVAACVCGSDLWKYRGETAISGPTPIGHEYVGVVEEVGDAVRSVSPGDFVIGGFYTSCNECAACRVGVHTSCERMTGYEGCQAELIRVANADGTLVATPSAPPPDLIPSLLSLSDVMCTGWHGAVMARVRPGGSVAVVGDGAVGLSAVLAASQQGAATIVAMSRHPERQALAREFGATHVVAERGEDGAAAVREIAGGLGADSVIECVGTGPSRAQAAAACRPGGDVGLLGLPHGDMPADALFWGNKGAKVGPAPVRAYLDELLGLVWRREINPGRVFDVELPLAEVAEGYAAMDTRRAIKVLLWP